MIDTTLIAKNLQSVFPEQTLEIRILGTKQGTLSGYFDNPMKAAKAMEAYNGKHNIYVTLNSPNTELIARSSNKLTAYAKQTTSDKDITLLNYIMIDFDPIRPAGISSTDEEKAEAKKLLLTVGSALKAQGFSDPIICDSGNGYHLLYLIHLTNISENVKLLNKGLSRILGF